jgi:hypothetical protein
VPAAPKAANLIAAAMPIQPAPKAAAPEPKATAAEPQAEPKAKAPEPKAPATEPKANAPEPKATGPEQRATDPNAAAPKAASTLPAAPVPKAEGTTAAEGWTMVNMPVDGQMPDGCDECPKNCFICLGLPDEPVALPCMHFPFCRKCIRANILQGNKSCPICRFEAFCLHLVFLLALVSLKLTLHVSIN